MVRPHIYVNGRFLTQPLSGVQRFALEINAALAHVSMANGYSAPVTLTPNTVLLEQKVNEYPVRAVGRQRGQLWEQFELPWATRKGILINLGNTAPLLGRHHIVIIHDAGVFSQPNSYSWKFRTWYRVLLTLLRYSRAHLITVSHFSRSELSKYLRIPAEQISVISEGAEHIKSQAADGSILKRHSLRSQGYVLAVGNLAPHKNLAQLSHLADALAQRGTPLVISGSVNTTVFSDHGKQTLPKAAVYVGRVSDKELRALYENAACFVFPSLYEGFGLPPLEAMLCGCPVVAADIPVLREICGEAAYYVNPHDPEAITRSVLHILDTPIQAQEMRQAGLSRAAAFTWEKAARSLLQITEAVFS
ncbi:glycosyltransferase family 4 protein [Acetobacter tropicalis]|uniref:Glycosyl transferase n=1 Tax=Acetobacter tropicalis TaxID=104102 RepID=A0A252ADE4_9PROT|nr:glycosyltransferase family 1 protein [Acetobacter tropicalis]OUI87602.1 glycosyl transferase [Acetobacter tropicalis]